MRSLLLWFGDQLWTGRFGAWLLRTFTPREDEPYDPRHGE